MNLNNRKYLKYNCIFRLLFLNIWRFYILSRNLLLDGLFLYVFVRVVTLLTTLLLSVKTRIQMQRRKGQSGLSCPAEDELCYYKLLKKGRYGLRFNHFYRGHYGQRYEQKMTGVESKWPPGNWSRPVIIFDNGQILACYSVLLVTPSIARGVLGYLNSLWWLLVARKSSKDFRHHEIIWMSCQF